MSPEKPRLLSSAPIFKGRVFAVKQDTVQFSGGRTAKLDIVEHPGSVAIVAIPQTNHLVLVRQYRHATGEYLWEIPAGTAEPGEVAIEGARRELAEETGYRCDRIRELHPGLYMTPGFCNERITLFLAEDLTLGETAFDEDEDIELRIFSVDEVDSMIGRGEIKDAKTLVGLALYRKV